MDHTVLASARREIAHDLTAGRMSDYAADRLMYADVLEDAGEGARAARSRLKARTARSPGLLWPRPGLLGVSAHQAGQLRLALARPFGLLVGTPGTGKTHCLASVVRAVVEAHGNSQVAVCAPTGKAAVRTTQALHEQGVGGLRATTVHQLLEVGRNGHDGGGWGFRRNEENPLPCRFLFTDEPSMLDTDLAAALLRACRPGTHVLLAGDPYQLPPVGHGAPLRDLIAAGAPCGTLTEIHRNDGLIVRACASIKEGKNFEVATPPSYALSAGRNLLHYECATSTACRNTLDLVLARAPGMTLQPVDPLWDVQVICATNEGHPLSRKALNLQLQELLNPGGAEAEGNPYRQGDKVICLHNGLYPLAERNEVMETQAYVANGEIGQAVQVNSATLQAQFSDPCRVIMVPLGKPKDREEADAGISADFDLAYAVTAHKAQGSQWPVVVVVIDETFGARQVCTREWLYTAVSRASQLCVLVGRMGVARMMVRRQALHRRKTFLAELLAGEV